jgi:ABC-2 type transport system permease protein
MKMTRLLAVAWKELVQLRRDRLTFGMVVGLPVIQLLLFGYAINTDVRHIPTVVLDHDATAASRDVPRSMAAAGTFDLAGELRAEREIEAYLRAGKAQVAVVIPPGYQADLLRRRPARLQVIVDGTDPQVVSAALGSVSGLFAARGLALTAARLSGSGAGGVEPIHVETATWYNPELRTAVFIVPGLIGLILTMTMVMLTAMALVRERERGTLEQLVVSPVTRLELVVGKISPYVVIGYIQMSLILLIGWLVFRVPVVGSLGLLYGVAFLFVTANLALGMTISTQAQTQQQAMQMTFFIFLPNVLLSGFMFPFRAMPYPAQLIGECLPLTHFLRLVRAIVLRGAGPGDLGQDLWAMALILTILVTVATLRFRKKLA